MQTLGQKIKRAIKISGESYTAVAARAGYGLSIVDKIVNDRPGPSLAAKIAVAKVAGVEFDAEAELDRNVGEPTVTQAMLPETRKLLRAAAKRAKKSIDELIAETWPG